MYIFLWKQVGFAHPGVAASVMVHLASDGLLPGEQCRPTVTVLLSDVNGKNHSLGTFTSSAVLLDCFPITFSVDDIFVNCKLRAIHKILTIRTFFSSGTHEVSCLRNPLVVNVTHDLTQPFFLTSSVILLFSSPSVAVRGVALRTSCHFSTFALTGCASQGGLSHS